MYLKIFTSYYQLCKIRIAFFSGLSAVAGYVLVAAHLQVQLVIVFAGVFLLASGASGLNQCQERATDALMSRTKDRPIPSGRIRPHNALLFSIMLAASGIYILYAGCGSMPAMLGLIATIWYNGVYTLLKKKSAFAAIPGALTGAMPPAIGWVAAGGQLSDPRLSAISLFFAIWQIPHFWLLLMNHGNEYRDAGLPSLTLILSRAQIARIVFQWIAATAVCGPALCLFGLAQSSLIQYSLLASSTLLILQGAGIARNSGIARSVFVRLNAYMIVVIGLLVSDRLYILSGHLPSGIEKIYALIASSYL
jgi:protoheme IX farnesyltransferase